MEGGGGQLLSAHMHPTPSRRRPQESKFTLFVLAPVLHALRSKELISPQSLENSHQATAKCSPLSVAHPEQKRGRQRLLQPWLICAVFLLLLSLVGVRWSLESS